MPSFKSVPAILLVLTATTLLAAPTATDTDKTFVAKVSQGGAYEVVASQFALTHAHAQDVIDLANTEVHDHTLVGQKLKRICAAAGVHLAPIPNAEFRARLEKLKAAVGPGFDQAYLADMVDIHNKDQATFAQEAQDGSGAFKSLAAETDKIVKRHQGALAVNTGD